MDKEYTQPAFPNPRWEGWGQPEAGMTLRDYFAAKASEEDIKAHIWKGYTEDFLTTGRYGEKNVIQRQARWTREEAKYRYADAMMKARYERV